MAARPLSAVTVIGDLPATSPTPAPRAVPQARANTEGPFPYPLQVEWDPSPQNYDYGRTDDSVDFIVIHYTEISYARTLVAFTNPSSYVSAHYVVRNDGHVTQMVIHLMFGSVGVTTPTGSTVPGRTIQSVVWSVQ